MNVTKQIQALRTEAAQSGDIKQVELCDLALSAPQGEDIRVDAAYERCIWAIGEAQSQVD